MKLPDLTELVMVAEDLMKVAGIWNLIGSRLVGEVTCTVTRRGTSYITG